MIITCYTFPCWDQTVLASILFERILALAGITRGNQRTEIPENQSKEMCDEY